MTAAEGDAGVRSLQIVGNARFGGATHLMLEWARFLRDLGVEVDVLATDETMIQAVKAAGGIGVVSDIFIPKEIAPATDARALRRLIGLLRRRRYDVVHTYTATPSFLGRLGATAARVPVVVNHQGGWAVNETSSTAERIVYTPLEYVANMLCTRNICVSHAERTKARRYRLAPDRKLVTIVNGIDTSAIEAALAADARSAVRRRLGVGDDTILIGTTGRLVAGKGNDDVVDALAILARERPELPVHLVMAGDGDQRAATERRITAAGLDDRITLLGFVDEVPALLTALDVFVTATLTEGLSVALLESLAAGTPTIATGIPANAEVVVDGRHGLLVPVERPDAIAEAIATLAADEELRRRLGTAGRERVATDYTMARMFDETEALYRQLLAARRREWIRS